MSLIPSSLRYLWHKWRAPQTVDFADMGLGIEARYSRCKGHWDKHLELSKRFIRESLDRGGDSCAILGAGRLLDIDLSHLCERYKEVSLYDLDPTVLPLWKRARRRYPQLELHQMDITGSMASWTTSLQEVVRRGAGRDDVESLLLSLNSVVPPISADTIVSLNTLSQLSIYWRQRVQAIVGFDLEQAIDANQKQLEEGHLKLLQGALRDVIIISDNTFLYYQQDKSAWVEEPALKTELTLERPFELKAHAQWLWHIAPQGIEEEEYGVIHEVSALYFKR